MVLPDDPGFPPPPAPQPAAEFRSDPGAIRTLIVAVAVCTLAAIVLSFMQNRGIGEPTLFGYAGSNPFSEADPATGWVANLWQLLTPLAIVSIAVAGWHVLQGSPLTRTIIKILLTAWVVWTIAGVMSVSLMPSDRDQQFINAHPGPNGKGGVGIQDESSSLNKLAKFAIIGIGFFFLLGLITMRSDRDADPALRLSNSGPHLSDGSAPAVRRRMSPNLEMGPETDAEFDWEGFRSTSYFSLVLVVFVPSAVGLLGPWLLDIAAVCVGLLTFPLWIVMGSMWDGSSDWQQWIFAIWAILSAVICIFHWQRPQGGLKGLLLLNQIIAILFAWVGQYGLWQHSTSDSSLMILLVSLCVVAIQGALLCTPFMHDAPAPRARYRVAGPVSMDLTPLDASYAAFCPDCGQQVHARNGLCLYCGGGVHAL